LGPRNGGGTHTQAGALGIFTFFTVGSRLLTYLVGGADPGLAELREELARLQAGGVLARRVFLASLLAEAYRSAGQPDRGLDVLAVALKAVEAGAERSYESALHRLRGELLLAVGLGAEDADACFHRAVATAQAIGARSLELGAATSLAGGSTSVGAAGLGVWPPLRADGRIVEDAAREIFGGRD
jgi:hypothetical protein